MEIAITLDYELFLGRETGSVGNCLFKPMALLCDIADKYDVKYTVFVDATYLCALKDAGKRYIQCANDYNAIVGNLQEIKRKGHSIQLHIHPQWAYSTYDGSRWNLDQSHYKLSDITKEEAAEIFEKAKYVLEEAIGGRVTAFRAGGFSAQPTSLLGSLFAANGITIDSSVVSFSSYNSSSQCYDYRNMPAKGKYRFSTDICQEDANGKYTEYPIGTYGVNPLFNWKVALTRILKQTKHHVLGDGISVATTKDSIKERLTQKTNCLMTIDGIKIDYLQQAVDASAAAGYDIITVIGHPKLATPYSLNRLERFISRNSNNYSFTAIR